MENAAAEDRIGSASDVAVAEAIRAVSTSDAVPTRAQAVSAGAGHIETAIAVLASNVNNSSYSVLINKIKINFFFLIIIFSIMYFSVFFSMTLNINIGTINGAWTTVKRAFLF